MQIPKYLNAWFHAAAKAYAIQSRSICRYVVSESMLNFIASHKLLTSYRALDSLLSEKLLLQQDEDIQQLNYLLDRILEDGITVGSQTRKMFESMLILSKQPIMRMIKDFPWSDLNGKGNGPLGVPLAFAAAFAWQWLISTNVVDSKLTSAEVTEGLLHGMIGDKEESEYFAHYMDTLVDGKSFDSNPSEIVGRRASKSRHRKRVTRFAKATWLLSSMAKYLPRDDDFRDVEACFISYPTVLLG